MCDKRVLETFETWEWRRKENINWIQKIHYKKMVKRLGELVTQEVYTEDVIEGNVKKRQRERTDAISSCSFYLKTKSRDKD